MSIKRYIRVVIIPFLSLFISCGCSGYGKIKLQPVPKEMSTKAVKRIYPTIQLRRPIEAVTLQDLKANWRDYIIHYEEIYKIGPAVIIFDPKHDNKTLQSDSWIKVENQERLSEAINNIQWGQAPKLFRILGADDQFYGYIFYAYKHDEMELYVSIRSLDINTLRVSGTLVRDYAPR
ncbi:MAG: hypothetical protein JSV50_03600 [Desulfobacteraceae bacterium]|nr:MAG: hypothetical protein JSV50_03600 [Desulfobacteraceae bacterium]